MVTATAMETVMAAKTQLHNQSGSAMVIALIISVIVAIFASTLPRYFGELNREYQVHNAQATALMLKENLISVLDNDAAWSQTVARNSNLSCLATPGAICSTLGDIQVYEADGTPLISNNPTDGFDIQGNVCHTFNATTGDDQCVYQYKISWSCVGACTATTFSINPLVAASPQVQLKGTLIYSPKRSNLKGALRTSDASGGTVSSYTINFARGHNDNTLSNYCNSINGTFDQTSGNCQATTGEPQSFTCAAHTWFQGFDASGNPICSNDVKISSSCASGQAALGYDSNGGIICGPF